MNRSALVRILFVLLTVFLIGLTVESWYDARLCEQSRQSLRLGLEELAVRVRDTSVNLREIIDFTKATALAKTRAISDERFVHDIRRDVDAFVSGAEQSDDITMLAFDYKKI